MKILLLLLVSHILGDVAFSSDAISRFKRSSKYLEQASGHILHSSIHGFFAGILLIFFTANFIWLKVAVSIFSVHLIIDVIRSNLEVKLCGTDKVKIKRSEITGWISGKNKNTNFKKISREIS